MSIASEQHAKGEMNMKDIFEITIEQEEKLENILEERFTTQTVDIDDVEEFASSMIDLVNEYGLNQVIEKTVSTLNDLGTITLESCTYGEGETEYVEWGCSNY
jgi:hypothetical protein